MTSTDIPPDSKRCPRCALVRPAADFYVQPKKRSGLSVWCKECTREQVRCRRAQDRDAANGRRRAAYRRRQARLTDWSSVEQLPLFPLEQVCRVCGLAKPLDHFHVNRARALGCVTICRHCARQYEKERYARQAQTMRSRRKAWYEAHRERALRYAQRYVAEHREEIRAYKAAPSRREREAALKRLRRAADPERMRAKDRAYDRTHRVRRTYTDRLWRYRNPDQARAKRTRAYARRRSAPGHFSGRDLVRIYREQDGLCFYCQRPLGTRYHVDHRQPLSRGGTNWPDNLACTCAACNLSKGALTEDEYRRRLAGARAGGDSGQGQGGQPAPAQAVRNVNCKGTSSA